MIWIMEVRLHVTNPGCTVARMHITMLNLVGEWLTTMTPLAIVEN